MQSLKIILAILLSTGSVHGQSTFSKIIDYPGTTADVGFHLRSIDGKLMLLSSHFCPTLENESQICSGVAEYDFEGNEESLLLVEDFEVFPGSVSLTDNDTILFLGIDKNFGRNTISYAKYNFSSGTANTSNTDFYTDKNFACEGILELNNAYYTYGHFDDLNPGERIKGFVKKWNKDFSVELGSWIYEENEFLQISDMRVTADRNLVFSLYESKTGPDPSIKVKIIKIDTLGQILAQKDVKDGDARSINKINLELDEQDNVYLNYDEYSKHIIEKLDPALKKTIWKLALPSDFYPLDRGYGVREIKIASNGDVLAVGEIDYIHQEIERIYSSFILRISPKGQIKWFKILTNEITEPSVAEYHFTESYLYDIIELPNGNIAGVGQIGEFTFSGPSQRIWLVVMDENGCIEDMDCNEEIYVLNAEPNSTQEVLEDKENIKLYPNPVKNKLFLQAGKSDIEYRILNLQGHVLLSGVYEDGTNVNALPHGVYFLQLVQKDKLFETIKFIKE